jgi:hypothetical protein
MRSDGLRPDLISALQQNGRQLAGMQQRTTRATQTLRKSLKNQ